MTLKKVNTLDCEQDKHEPCLQMIEYRRCGQPLWPSRPKDFCKGSSQSSSFCFDGIRVQYRLYLLLCRLRRVVGECLRLMVDPLRVQRGHWGWHKTRVGFLWKVIRRARAIFSRSEQEGVLERRCHVSAQVRRVEVRLADLGLELMDSDPRVDFFVDFVYFPFGRLLYLVVFFLVVALNAKGVSLGFWLGAD